MFLVFIDLLNELKEITGLAFSDLEEVEFSWMIEENKEVKEADVRGWKIKVRNIEADDYNKIIEFFDVFSLNRYNVNAGTAIGLTGYQKDKMVCVIVEENDDLGCLLANKIDDEGLIDDEAIRDVTVKCGKLKESSFQKVGEVEERSIEVNQGEEFKISLKSNVSTGYKWQPDYDYEYIEIIDISYIEPEVEVLGAPGGLVFHLKALQRGEKTMTFSYIRSWEEKAPIKKINYQIVIK